MPVELVIVEVGGAAGLGAALDGIEEACRSGGRFAVLVDARGVPADTGDATPARRGLTRRLRGLRGDLAERCVGLAFLASPAELQARRRRGLRAARLLLGCPVEAVASPDAARTWLAEKSAAWPEQEQLDQ